MYEDGETERLTRQEAEDYITKAVQERYLEIYKENIEEGMTPLEVRYPLNFCNFLLNLSQLFHLPGLRILPRREGTVRLFVRGWRDGGTDKAGGRR